MPKVKLSKKQIADLADLIAPPQGVKAPKDMKKTHAKLAAIVLKSSAANDKGKKKDKAKKLQPVTTKLIGRKEMRKTLDDLIRKEEIKHVTKPEFLLAAAKRATMLAESYNTIGNLVNTAKIDPIVQKQSTAKQA